MTNRLYYTEPSRRNFDALVTAVQSRDGHTVVELDATAFYPTSGGQPFDVGRLGAHTVVDVVDDDDGAVWHVLADGSGQPAIGDAVHGEIDWARRFDHMQQHTGQHILSAAFDRVFGVRTVSFHLGVESATIDLAREVTEREIASAEDEANRIIWEDRPIAVRFASKEDAQKLPLRKESMREGTLRLIDIQDWDLSACGGTHLATTGAVGAIAIASWERFKGGQRIEFLCGARVVRRFRAIRDAVGASARLLSVLPAELPATIERLQTEAKEQRRTLNALQIDLARYRAEELAASAEDTPAGKLVATALDADAVTLKALAATITKNPGFLVALFSSSSPALAVIARSADRKVSSQQVLASLIATFSGRGGGKPDLAQGGGLAGDSNAILTAAKQLLTAGA